MRRVEEIAIEKHCKPSQLALAWVLAQGDDIVPIPGTKRRKYLEENVGALNVNLSQEDLARIDEVFPPGRSRRQALSRSHDGHNQRLIIPRGAPPFPAFLAGGWGF